MFSRLKIPQNILEQFRSNPVADIHAQAGANLKKGKKRISRFHHILYPSGNQPKNGRESSLKLSIFSCPDLLFVNHIFFAAKKEKISKKKGEKGKLGADFRANVASSRNKHVDIKDDRESRNQGIKQEKEQEEKGKREQDFETRFSHCSKVSIQSIQYIPVTYPSYPICPMYPRYLSDVSNVTNVYKVSFQCI